MKSRAERFDSSTHEDRVFETERNKKARVTMKTKKMTVKEAAIAKARRTGHAIKHNRTTKYEAEKSGDSIIVREYSNDSEVEMLLNEYQVAL